MNRLLLFLFYSYTISYLTAQESKLPFYKHEMVSGIFYKDSTPVTGTRFFIGCDYYSHYFDTSSNSVLLMLRYKTDNTNEYTKN